MQFLLSKDQFILITLLIQLAVMAAISTIFVRFETFKKMLFNEELGSKRKLYFIFLVGSIFAIGVFARIFLNYKAADLTLPASFLVGLLAGPLGGFGVGIILGLPALLFKEFLALPMAIFSGLLGGLIYLKEKSLEERMNFSPFSIFRLPSYLTLFVKKREIAPQLLIIIFCVFLSAINISILNNFQNINLYGLFSKSIVVNICIVLGMLASVGIPLKIWNNTRVELLLIEKEKNLIEAKLEALKSKLKPHFLFNTLNTIFSSIRTDPDRARSVVLRLSELLRSILDSKGEFCKLSDEVNLLDSYLSIEEARFGKRRVFFRKEIADGALNLFVPTMLLQPIVENSIKHGISKNVRSGEISLHAKREGDHLLISIKDNGVGIDPSRLEIVKKEGIGLSSVDERLKVLFEDDFEFTIESKINEGTHVRLKIPVITETKEFLT